MYLDPVPKREDSAIPSKHDFSKYKHILAMLVIIPQSLYLEAKAGSIKVRGSPSLQEKSIEV